MAIPRAATGAFPVQHPHAPPEGPVFLKGKYAVRYDGAIMMNNPVINARTDMQFVDELPQYHIDGLAEAQERDDATLKARLAVQAAQEDKQALNAARERDALAAYKIEVLNSSPSAETEAKSAAHVIANAETVDALASFVEKAYGKKLDKRKNLNTLRHEAETYRQMSLGKKTEE